MTIQIDPSQSTDDRSPVAVIVQARMGSSRLPGKVLAPVAGKPILEHMIERLRSKPCGEILVATTSSVDDLPIVICAERLGVRVVRGSETDVLSRYVLAAKTCNATTVVRLTSDCPLIEPQMVFDMVTEFQSMEDVDYYSNELTPSLPVGLSIEVFTTRALLRAHREANKPYHREHVTPYLYEEPGRFRTRSLVWPEDLSHHRWTVDTPEDLALIQNIFSALYHPGHVFTMSDVLGLLADHPEWSALNAHVQQKGFRTSETEPSG